MTAKLFVSVKRSLFVISEIIVWLCAGVVLIIGAYQSPPPALREFVLAFAGTLGTLWSIRLCFKTVETPDDLKGIEDEPEKAVFRNRVRRYGKIDKVIGEGRIVLQGVRYSYPGTKETAVNGISLEIEPGERFGIVGQTGSGKTTLLRLIGREADTSEGTVFIDGADIKDYTSAALDKIFSEKVSLCEGTPPNERATTPTIIIATQSTKPVMFCDRIAVVAGGTLAAVGTHDDLLRNNEIYRELYTADHPFEPLPPLAPLSDESFTKVLHEAEKE
jgi:ABC-type multidrug transport system fused ATPase/permease subunit